MSYTSQRLLRAVISESASGDRTIIAGAAGKRIFIHRLLLSAQGNVIITLKRGTTALAGPIALATRGSLTMDSEEQDAPDPFYICEAGEAFVINLSAAIAIGGNVWYAVGPL